jgi:hypothetical protein
MEEHFASATLDTAKWGTFNGAQNSQPTAIGGGDFAIALTGNAAGGMGFFSLNGFSRGQNLTATFKLWHDPTLQYTNVGGPWVKCNTPTEMGYTYPGLNWVEAGIAGQDSFGFPDIGGNTFHNLGIAEGEQAWGWVFSGNGFAPQWAAATSKATAVTMRVILGNATGARFETAADGVTFTGMVSDLGTVYDTRGTTACAAVSGNQKVSSSPVAYVGFSGGYTFPTWVDDIVVTRDLGAPDGTVTPTPTPIPSATPIATAGSAPHASALLIVNTGASAAADAAIKAHLEFLGATVTVIGDAATTTSNLTGKDLVVVSATADAAAVGTKLTDAAVPVVCCLDTLLGNLNMVATAAGKSGAQANTTETLIQMAGHPLAAGLSGTVILSRPTTVSWGVPAGADAQKVATLVDDAGKWLVFGYDTNGRMEGGFIAPAPRVGLFLGSTTASTLTGDGWKLFDAACKWASNWKVPVELSTFEVE